ncbi:MAG: imidazole glycerol phosphate synthase subunit HisF [Nitrosopumilaceae archaeon]|nr:imidazole glycerol phosphate synthase subunit HisF [Nitrosopumilaceae archaeon]
MTLTKRIIPCLDVDDYNVVKGLNFSSISNVGNPVFLAKKYNDSGADELIFLDITASQEKRKIVKLLIAEVAKTIDIPFTVGGGISNLEQAHDVLLHGADKIAINTSAVQKPQLIEQLMDAFGKQCVVIAIDAKRNYTVSEAKNIFVHNGKKFWFEVYIYGGKYATGLDVITWAQKVKNLGAGEILLTSIDMDGTKNGYDLNLTSAVVNNVSVPVIASGGCGHPQHMLDVFQISDASAALAASIFHYDSYSIQKVKKFLQHNKINVRL